MNPAQAEQVLREWRNSALYWAKHATTIRAMFAPVTAALIEEAGIVAGQRILDVAGGAGEPSLSIAELLGPGGFVVYTDPIAEMVQAAQTQARARGLTNLEFHRCPADALPFADSSFDVAVSRLGIMFFPEPLTALREMLRVVKPGGRLSLVVWYKSDANPFSYEVSEIVARHIPTDQTQLPIHDAFRFAESGKLAALLKDAGAIDVRERLLKFEIAAPISVEEFWTMRSETSGTLRDKLLAVSPEKREEIKAEVTRAVARYSSNNQIRFPAQMLIVSGNKPK